MNLKKKKNNTTIKIIAIIFAIFLWAYVMGEVNPVVTKTFTNVEVKYEYLDQLKNKNLVLMEPEKSVVSVQVNGRRNDILKMENSDFMAKIDFRGYGAGEQKIPVEVSSDFDDDLLLDYNPKQILVNIDKNIEKQVPITINKINDVPSPYSAGKIVAQPNKVIIKGPKLVLDKVQNIQVNLDLDQMKENTEEVLPIQLLGEDGNEVNGLSKEPQIVNIKVEILKNKRIEIKPNVVGQPIEGYELMSIEASPKAVLIRGQEDIVDSLKQVVTKPVDISYSSGDIEKEAFLDLVEGAELIEPETIEIKAHIEKIIERTLSIENSEVLLDVGDIGGNVDLEKSPSIYEVIVKGPETIVENLKIEDLKPKIVNSDLKIGLNKITIDLEVPSGVEYLDREKSFDFYIIENS